MTNTKTDLLTDEEILTAANIESKLTDAEILAALGDDGDNMMTEFYLHDARVIEALVRQKENGRIDASITKPPFIEGKDYSENVWGWDENDNLLVVEYFDNGDGCYWANCYGDVFGDGEFDDDYDIRFWKRINFPETPK